MCGLQEIYLRLALVFIYLFVVTMFLICSLFRFIPSYHDLIAICIFLHLILFINFVILCIACIIFLDGF